MEPESSAQISPIFFVTFSTVAWGVGLLVGLLAGYLEGKKRGKWKEIENRMCRDIIQHVRKTGSIPPYYNKSDIELAQRYGKRRGFFFTVGDPPPFKVIRGGKQ
jgi:hypothetical protein